ncbi:MAG: phosphotransferase [Alphaproteobacteria bacterium]|nr:phosphotransferase [Alphaproteobacteria bacterium]
MSTPEPWEPEIALDPARAAALVRQAFPELAGVEAAVLGEGWDNLALRFGDQVFRLPRRQLGADCMEAEIAVMPAVARRLGLPVSAPERHAGPLADYPWRFAGYRLLEGLTGCDPRLDDTARAAVAPALGRALAQLHGLPLDDPELAAAPPDRLRRTELPYRAAQVRERVAPWEDGPAIEAMMRPLVDAAPWSRPLRLVHGDLYARHVLIHASGGLAGLIDWGDLHRGDPALDLSVMWTLLPPWAHGDFIAAYQAAGGWLDPDALRRARFRGLYSAVALRLYGAAVGDSALLQAGSRGLAWLRQTAPR